MPKSRKGIVMPYHPTWPSREFWERADEAEQPRFGFRGVILAAMMIGSIGLGIVLGAAL